jgi:hypothetical protein
MIYPKKDFERRLTCILTAEEIEQNASDAAEKSDQHDVATAQEDAAKKEAKDAKTRGEALVLHIKDHLKKVRTGEERRLIDCFEQYDPDTDKMQTFRTDTGELIDTRNPLDKERQGQLMELPPVKTSDQQDVEDREPAGA